jgi:hypothetical protein
MSKETYLYKARGGVCVATNPDFYVPHEGDALTEKEKEVTEHFGTPQVCAACRCLFQPEKWEGKYYRRGAKKNKK